MKDDTEVDLYNLHEDWSKQAKLRRDAGLDQGKIADEVRAKKAYIKYRTGKVSLAYSTGTRMIKDSEGNAIKKPSVGAIKASVDSDEELYTLEKELNVLLKALDICSSFTSAIDVKKYALQDEVRLYLGGYWADPYEAVEARKGGVRDYVKDMDALKNEQEEAEDRQELRKRRRKKDE